MSKILERTSLKWPQTPQAWSVPHWVLVKFKGVRFKWGCEKKTPPGLGTRIWSNPGRPEGLPTWSPDHPRHHGLDGKERQEALCRFPSQHFWGRPGNRFNTSSSLKTRVVDNLLLTYKGMVLHDHRGVTPYCTHTIKPHPVHFPQDLLFFFICFFPTYLSPATHFT